MMKSYFELHKSFSPIYKGGSLIFDSNTLITPFDNELLTTDLFTCAILKRERLDSSISFIYKNENYFFIGFVNGKVLNYFTNEVYEYHKSMITSIVIYKNFLITGSLDKKVKIINLDDMVLYSTYFCKNSVTFIVCNCDDYIFASDVEGNIYKFNFIKKSMVRFKVHSTRITKLVYFENMLYSSGRDGKFIKYDFCDFNDNLEQATLFLDSKNGEKEAGKVSYLEKQLDFSIEDFSLHENIFLLVGDISKIFEINLNMDINSEKMIFYDNGLKSYENMKFKNIQINEKLILTTTEDEIIFLDPNYYVSTVIIGNNDEITDVLTINNYLLIATNSGRLRYCEVNQEEGKFCCKGILLEGHDETIMCLSYKNNNLLSCSRDGSCILWDLKEIKNNNDHENKKQKKISDSSILNLNQKIKTHLESANSCDITDKIFVSVGKDMTLQIFNYKEKIEQVFTRVVHNKEINSVKINENYSLIGTASQDKTCKIFDFEGNEISTLIGHKRGVWSIDFGQEIIATSSTDETIRIWNLKNYSCIKVLEGHNCSVIKVKIFNDDRQIISCGNDGLIRIWDLKKGKCISILKYHKEKVWSVFFDQFLYTGCSDGSICILKDMTAKVVAEKNEKLIYEKETKFKIEKFINEGMFLEALEMVYLTKDTKKIFYVISENIRKKEDIEKIFRILKKDKNKFNDLLEKSIKSFKYTDVIQKLIKEAIKYKLIDKDNVIIKNTLSKHLTSSDDLLITLSSYELLFKEIIINKI